jgi:4-hydroxy-3-methylbut-2-enyl diphosphate reductase
VERAYRIALEQTGAGKPVFMLGNLVHNTQVIDKFKKLGVRTVGAVSEIPSGSKGVLLISAHGVPPGIYEEAREKGLSIVDTTCAWVKKAQKIARELAEEGRRVIIVGDKGHVEVKGLVGWSGGKAAVIEDLAELDSLSISRQDRLGVLAQTTQTEKRFNEITAALKKAAGDVREFNTICGATAKRQNAAIELANKVALMLVIGDKMSANTKRLTELCTGTGTQTHQIQIAAELEPAWLAGQEKIGVTAGASTPEWVVKQVVEKLEEQRSGKS